MGDQTDISCQDGIIAAPTILLAILSPYLSEILPQPPEATYNRENPLYLSSTLNLSDFLMAEVKTLLELGSKGSCMVSKSMWCKIVELMRVLRFKSIKIDWKRINEKRSCDSVNEEEPPKKKKLLQCLNNCGKSFGSRTNMMKHLKYCNDVQEEGNNNNKTQEQLNENNNETEHNIEPGEKSEPIQEKNLTQNTNGILETADRAWRQVMVNLEHDVRKEDKEIASDEVANDEDISDICEAELQCRDCQRGGDHFHSDTPMPTILTGIQYLIRTHI